MNDNKNVIWKNSMNYGAIIGLVGIGYSLILFFVGLDKNQYAGWLNYLILILGIIYGTKSLRENHLNGSISYGKALSSGTLISFFAGIILCFYIYVFFKFINPNGIQEMLDLQVEKMIENGYTEEQIEQSQQFTGFMRNAGYMSFAAILGNTFIGFLLSLITSAFLKREGNPFASAMQNINENQDSESNQ